MEDEDKAASKPSDPQGTDKHTGATTFATSVERETVFPAIAFGSSSNFAYQDILEGSMSSDARITMCGSVGRYNSSTMPRVNRNLHVDTTLNLANDNPDTVRECMPSEKMTASFPDQSVESNSNASVVIEGGKLANESFHLQTGFVPHEVTSSKLKLHYEENIPAEGNKNANVVGQFELRGPDSLQNQESPAQDNEAGTTINDQLYEKAERASSKDGNVASAKTSVDDKKTSVDDTNTTNTLGTLNAEASNRSISIINFTNFANRLNERDCGALQTFGENPAQVKEVGMTGDDVSYKEVEGALGEDEYIASAKKTPAEGAGRANNLETCNVVWCNSPVSERNSLNAVNGMNEREWLENIAIERKAGRTVDDVPYKEAEKVSSEDEDFDFTDKTSVDGANLTANLGTGEASTSPKREMKNSGPVNLNENLPGTSGLIQCAETGAVSSDAGCTANGIRNGHVSSSFLVDATEVVTEKLATDVKTITKDVTLAGVGLTTEIRNAVVDQSIFEGKPNDFKSSRNGQSSAYAEHNSAFTGLIHNIIGQSSGDTTSVTNIKASDAVSIGNLACSDATPIANIAPCDANILTKMQGPLNAIPDMILVDGNTSESCRTELPSIEPGSFTAISEGGLEFYAKQDATQTCPEYGVKEELAKEDAIQTCAQGSVGEEVAKQDTCAEQSMEEEVTKQDAMETCTEHHGEEETTKRDEEPVKQGAMQTSVECGRGEEVIGQKVKKKFGKRNYKGKVVGFDQETLWYKVTYEDGDVEDLEWEELEPILLHLKGENLEMKRRKRHSRLGVEPRSFKRVRRPNEPMASKARGRGRPAAEKGKSVEIDDGKEDEKSGLDNEDFSIVDSADMPSSATKTSKRRHSEQLDESIKKTKVEGEAGVEHDCSRNRTRLTVESKPQIHSDLTENRFSTRRNSASSASNLESVSGLNADTANSVPNFQDKAKSEIPELSDKNVLPQGGGISLIGRKTKKDFGGQCYEGEVIDYDYRAKYYKVKYEDGDEEELDWSELEPTLVLSDQKPLSFKSLLRARNMAARLKVQQQSTSSKDSASNLKETLVLDQGAGVLSEKQKPASVLEEVKESSQEKENSPGRLVTSVELTGRMPPPPRPLAAARFASAGDADVFEYYGWGEVVGYDKAKCPELGASKLLPTSSPIVHLAASQHHLAAITAAGQVWLWRNKHGNIHTRCNEWEHIASLEDKGTVLVDIAGPDLDRASGGYEADQEDQVPDPFYLVAVCADGQDFILQGSQPQETVRTYQLNDEPQHPSLKAALLQQGHSALETVGRIVQVSVGTVEAPDESPLVGYIADNDHVYIRSATRDYMEEVNLVSGFTGKPIKIQCGRVYHAIIMTDDGRAWTWGCGYYPGLNTLGSSGFSAATCQPAVGTLVGRKVIDVGCYGEDFIALTSDGDVHQWTHAVPNPAAGVYNVPATPLYGHGPCIPHGDKLKQVSIGAGMCAGVTESGRVHTWRTAMKGGLIGILVSEKEALTPLGHEENHKDTAIVSLGNRIATKVICIAGSLIVVVKKKARGRIGPRRKRQKNNSESVIGEQS